LSAEAAGDDGGPAGLPNAARETPETQLADPSEEATAIAERSEPARSTG